MKRPPGPFGHPLFGNLEDLKSRILDFFCELPEKYGDVSNIRFSVRNVSFVQSPDVIQHILQENNRNYTKSLRYEQLRYLLGNGLLTSEGEFWLRQRRMIQPAFHKHRLESLCSEMVSCTNEFLVRMRNHSGDENINLASQFMALTLQIVGKTLLSTDVHAESKNVGDALSFLLRAVNIRTRTPVLIPLWVPLPHHIKIKKAVAEINRVLDKIFRQRRLSGAEVKQDLLTMLMEARYEDTGEPMSDQQLRDEVMTIFVAGHETTANALSWTVYLLSQHPDHLRKCREEIRDVLGKENPTPEKLRSLRYLTMVIDESMRLYPPAWVIGRKTIKPDRLGEYPVAPGHNLLICPYSLHRDRRFWHDPDKFIPERFEPEEIKKRPKFAYLPFGGGPRLCIGNNFAMMEMQVALSMFLREFDFIPDKDKKVEPEPLITLRPRGGLYGIMNNV